LAAGDLGYDAIGIDLDTGLAAAAVAGFQPSLFYLRSMSVREFETMATTGNGTDTSALFGLLTKTLKRMEVAMMAMASQHPPNWRKPLSEYGGIGLVGLGPMKLGGIPMGRRWCGGWAIITCGAVVPILRYRAANLV
jgi:hypothetical protein